MKIVAGSLLFVAIAGATAAAQPGDEPAVETPSLGANAGTQLSMAAAVELALKQQPQLRQNYAQIEAARGRVDGARVARRPTVSLGASVQAGSSRSGFCQPLDADGDGEPDGVPLTCGGFFSPQVTTNFSTSANWRIWDFGQTGLAIRAAELSAEATEATVATAVLDVRTNVEVTYLEAVARQRLIGVAQTTVDNEILHVDQARRFVEAGARDPIEVVQAQSRAANAKSALAQAQSSQAISLANLRAAIGWIDAERSPVVATEWPAPPAAPPESLTALLVVARLRRPEVVAVDKQIQAAEASYDVSAAQRRPVLNANASTQWNPGSTEWRPEPSWSASLSLQWQLYDGGRAAADKRVARANVTVAEAQRDALLVSLTSELELARAQIFANRANVEASTEAVGAARAQLKLAEGRYAQGLGSQIELADAQVAVTTAEGNLVTAEWQLARAWAQLRRSLGGP